MFTNRQLEIITDAVEDYAILVDEDLADQCDEILHIIEAHFYNSKKWLTFHVLILKSFSVV